MTIKEKSIKILWAGSGGICAFEGCWERLCRREAKDVAPYPLGEMAHICGDKKGSLRYNASQAEEERIGPRSDLDSGLIEMTISDKIKSGKQKYRLTELERSVVEGLK